MKDEIKIALIICVCLIIVAFVYSHKAAIKTALGIGALGIGAYLAAGGTLAGYKLYQKYIKAGFTKDIPAVESEAAAGATEITAAGEAATEAGTIVSVGEATAITGEAVAGAAAVAETAGAAAAVGEAAAGAGVLTEIAEGIGVLAILL